MLRALLFEPFHPNPVEVEKSVPGGRLEEEVVIGVEDERQIVPPTVSPHQSSFYKYSSMNVLWIGLQFGRSSSMGFSDQFRNWKNT